MPVVDPNHRLVFPFNSQLLAHRGPRHSADPDHDDSEALDLVLGVNEEGVSTHDSEGERGSVRGRGWQDPRGGWLQKGRHCVASVSLDFRGSAGRI